MNVHFMSYAITYMFAFDFVKFQQTLQLFDSFHENIKNNNGSFLTQLMHVFLAVNVFPFYLNIELIMKVTNTGYFPCLLSQSQRNNVANDAKRHILDTLANSLIFLFVLRVICSVVMR